MTLTFTDPKTLDHDALEEGTAFAPRFDAHGLIPVVTIETGTNDVLMVAHMNAEALARTLGEDEHVLRGQFADDPRSLRQCVADGDEAM